MFLWRQLSPALLATGLKLMFARSQQALPEPLPVPVPVVPQRPEPLSR